MIEAITKTARRKPGNEAMLMWSLSGAVVCLVSYYMMMTGQSVPNPLGMNIALPTMFWGLVIGGVLALVWYGAVKGKIQAAREAHAAHLHQAEADKHAEIQRRVAEMKAKEAVAQCLSWVA